MTTFISRGSRVVMLAALTAGYAAPALGDVGLASFSAVVSSRGATIRSLGVRASSNPSLGKYVVEFSSPVADCAYVAAPYGAAGGQASVRAVSGNSRAIEISTFNKSGVPANLSFSVLVSCSLFGGIS
jgi:hypothetical protein